MYLRILLKDLMKKRTMNMILLLFITLASMFVASSVNNILSIATAMDSFFDKAGMTDYFVATLDRKEECVVESVMKEEECVESYGIEKVLYINPNDITQGDKNFKSITGTSVLMSIDTKKINFFDENDQCVKEIQDGEILIANKFMKKEEIEIGDYITISVGGYSKDFRVVGSFKDALLGSDMMGMIRYIISESDYREYYEKGDQVVNLAGSLCYINTKSVSDLEKVLNEQDNGIIFNGDKDLIKVTYIMDMVVAGVLLIVSFCLIMVAFVVLQFTINFTLSGEFREIGVMKAIGITNEKIRGLYIIKYLFLSIVGACIGFFASIPFGNMLLKDVSNAIVIGNKNQYGINLLCALLVIVIVLLFCYLCTNKVKKFTPVDAIRNGTTGERYKKKGILRLSKSKLSPSNFLAVNDVLSSPKRFGIIILTFALSLSLVFILSNTKSTLQSDSLIKTFCMLQTDVYFSDEGKQMDFMKSDGESAHLQELRNIERTLAGHGMEAVCTNEIMLKLTIVNGEKSCRSITNYGVGTKAEQYDYYEGTPPRNNKEIAITSVIAKKIDATIGDTVTIQYLDGNREYMITALYQSMNNMGEGIRLHESDIIDYGQCVGFYPFQIDFKDNPSKKEIEERIETIKEIYNTDQVFSPGEYANRLTGVADIIKNVEQLVLSVVLVIIALITVLMERSFIEKERGEIAILKAVGINDGTIMKWHISRFIIAMIVAMVLSLLVQMPLTKLSIDPIFNMMGAQFGVPYKINYMEIMLIYPIVVSFITIVAAGITAMYTKKIMASESSNIE